MLDDYGSETAWTLKRLGQTLYEGGPYQDGTNGEVVTVDFCLEEGCYISASPTLTKMACAVTSEMALDHHRPQRCGGGHGRRIWASEQIQFCADESLGLSDLDGQTLQAYPFPRPTT